MRLRAGASNAALRSRMPKRENEPRSAVCPFANEWAWVGYRRSQADSLAAFVIIFSIREVAGLALGLLLLGATAKPRVRLAA